MTGVRRRLRLRRLRGDGGMVTAELAAAVPVLVLLLMLALSAVQAGWMHVQAVDAARDGALAAARGDDADGAAAARRIAPGADVSVSRGEGHVTVRVVVAVRLPGAVPEVSVSASSSAPLEPLDPSAEPAGARAAGTGVRGTGTTVRQAAPP